MNARAKLLMERLLPTGARAALITKRENMRYFTGYTGEGCLLALENRLVILTDFRYTEMASIQAPDCECLRTRAGVTPQSAASELLKAEGIGKMAFEPYQMTVAEYDQWKAAMPEVEFVSLESLSETLREVKDEGELQNIRKAAEIACAAFDQLLNWVRPGMTEKQIQADLDYAMLKLGSEGCAFDTIACAGPNGSLPHAVPSDRPVRTGELLTLDFGAIYGGYMCDMTRTISFGKISDELRAIYDAVLEAQTRALSAVAPGAMCKDIDAVAREYLDGLYPGAFGHSLGHGVGLFIHEQPGFSPKSAAVLQPGHVVTVEPGVYIPGLGGCRIEDMVLITENGYINPSTAPKMLIRID